MNARYNLRAGLLALAVLICLPFAGSGAARAAENFTGAWGLISYMGTQNPIYDALWLKQGNPADAFVHNNLIYVNMDMQYNYPSYKQWESATWRPAASFPNQRFPASLLGTDAYTQPIEGRYIQLRNLTLERADLDAQNVQFRFSPLPPVAGATTSLTLNNGSLTALNPPGFYADALFTLTASGDSTLSNWDNGRISSQTTLNVTPGGKLTLFRIAFNHSTDAVDSWYFDNPSANVATIDNGTLKLDQSYVTFGRPTVGTPGVMTFQNHALLELTGEAAQLNSGYFNFNNSALNVGGGTHLRARAEVSLDTGAVTVGSAGDIHTDVLTAKGSSTLALPAESDARFKSVTTSGLQIAPNPTLIPNATLSLNGNGTLAVTGNLIFNPPGAGQSYGRIDVNDDTHLLNLGGIFDIRPGDIINIKRTSDDVYGLMSVTNGGTIQYRGITPPGTNHVTNEGEIAASNDGTFYVPGHATLLGSSQGRLDIDEDGTLDIGSLVADLKRAENSLTTDNEVYLGNFSTLVLTLDPSGLKNDKLNVGPTIPSSSILYIDQFADLRLAVVNDSKLTAGAKFRLINYVSLGAGSIFNGYPNNHIFSLGLNAYQINYADTADAGYAYANAITLTVVDEPALSPAVQQVAGVVGLVLTPTSALTPLNFEPGCVLTYTSPSLPAGGLILNSSIGVITGTPTGAQAAANIIITGTGTGTCNTQSAQATVTLTIANIQTITFAAPPTPTFTPNGTFVVSATATSGGVVVYSSQTPAVCTTNGGSTITMLGAGTCAIAANQPGNANYAPAPQVTQNITIAPGTQAVLVLSVSPPSIALTGTSLQTTSLLRTTGGNGGGLVTYQKVSGPCNLAGASVTGTGTGNCVFNATKAADANYAVSSTSNNVTVVVTQNPLTVSYPANPLTIGTPASLSPTVSGATGPVTYLLLFGPLPSGLTLNPVTGVISGTPTGPAGHCPVAIKATNGAAIFVASLTLTVQAPVQPIPTLSEWGMLILASLMVLAAGWRGRRIGPR